MLMTQGLSIFDLHYGLVGRYRGCKVVDSIGGQFHWLDARLLPAKHLRPVRVF